MIDETQKLLDNYWAWLKDNTLSCRVSEKSDWFRITTPHLDRHNDCLEIYTKHENGGFVLTDDGYIIQDLEMSGCKINDKRKQLLGLTLNGFGVQLGKNNELLAHATRENFGIKKHNLLQAMLAVNDLFYLASPIVESLFYEDVVAWLEIYDIRYTPKIKFTGTSGYDHMFDFVIPKSKSKPERILRTINRPTRESVQSMIFACIDTNNARPSNAHTYAILNDSECYPDSALQAMRSHKISSIIWSQREEARAELAA